MQVKVSSTYYRPVPKVKVNGDWRLINVGWVKVNGAWCRFKWSNVATINVTLGQQNNQMADGTPYERRSAIRTGGSGQPPGDNYIGAFSETAITIDGQVFQLRGIETGSDAVGGMGAWGWLSLQFFGNVSPQKLSCLINLNGQQAEFKESGYDSNLDMSFLSYRFWKPPYTPPINTPLSITF